MLSIDETNNPEDENHLAAFTIFYLFPIFLGAVLSFLPGIIQGIIVAICMQILAKNHFNDYTKGMVVANISMIACNFLIIM